MARWLESSSSLNFTNKHKLSNNIKKFEGNISVLKERLLSLLSLVDHWEIHCKELAELSLQQRLTAKHILHLKPLLDKSEDLQSMLEGLEKPSSSPIG